MANLVLNWHISQAGENQVFLSVYCWHIAILEMFLMVGNMMTVIIVTKILSKSVGRVTARDIYDVHQKYEKLCRYHRSTFPKL